MRKSFSSGSKAQFVLRVIVGVLLVANVVAAGLILYPPGGSAEELERQLVDLQAQAKSKREALEKTKAHVAAVDLGRAEGDKFLGTYFLTSRARSEQLLSQLGQAAAGSKIKERDRSIAFEPIDGSDTLSMMSITANYEGEYADLLHFVHEIDRSPSLMIIESLNAAPQTGSKLLSISMKLNTFVREDSVE